MTALTEVRQGVLALDAETETFLAEQETAIRLLGGRIFHDYIEIGHRLKAAKGKLGHGNWLPWLDRAFGWSDVTAGKFMRVAEAFAKFKLGSNLEPLQIEATALYLLAAPGVPEAAREEAVSRAAEGEKITKAEAERLTARYVAEAIAAERHRIDDELADAIEAATQELGADNENLKAKIAELTKAAAKPGAPEAIAMLQSYYGKKRLDERTIRGLAVAMNCAISYNRKIYAPMTDDEAQQADRELEANAHLRRTLGYFETEAPAPEEMARIIPDGSSEVFDRMADAAMTWLRRFQKARRSNQ